MVQINRAIIKGFRFDRGHSSSRKSGQYVYKVPLLIVRNVYAEQMAIISRVEKNNKGATGEKLSSRRLGYKWAVYYEALFEITGGIFHFWRKLATSN